MKDRFNCSIAIIGVSCRFPGAPEVAAFWDNLRAGRETISRFAETDLEDAFDGTTRADSSFVKARSVLDNVDLFDAAFFGMHASEAALTDPQHRIFLECCWEALEDAGCDPSRYGGSIGVIAGTSIGTYFLRNVLADRATVARFTSNYQVDDYPLLLGSGHDFLATRVAYKLDLRGPAMTLQSACSTSLTAVVQAVQALILGQADVMLAGAASITFPQRRGYRHQAGGMVSSDGHCRTFDARASGTVFGDGAGVVVLKRLADALADGDSVYAVVRGFGINNDGSGKVGFTAPSVDGQTAAIRAAHEMAEFDPASIEYVECHGTATPLGDPIEFAALSKAFGGRTGAAPTCALGSVKSNIGHLDVAAGMSGLIKTALAIRYGAIPPSLHFESPNAEIGLAASPFYVNTSLVPWRSDGRRRAGVSAFGVGGTNVHLALEAAPAVAGGQPAARPELLVVSARTERALELACERLAARLRADSDLALGDVAFTLQTGRRAFAYRRAFVASTPLEAALGLERSARSERSVKANDEIAVAFVFPGQGTQYPDMGRGLYETLPIFRRTLDYCAEALRTALGRDIRDLLYAPAGGADASALRATAVAQPALFALSYALAQTWLEWGIDPVASLGHSVGEFVAACLAGVMSLEDALAVVAERGRLIQGLPAGAMTAVRLGENALLEILPAGLSIAALNSRSLSVVSGPIAEIEEFEQALTARDVGCRRLETSHAFHSAMMDPILEPLARRIAAVPLRVPARPYVSCVTGTWITAEEATSPAYWAQHCRLPVRFGDGVATLVAAGVEALVEAGAGSTLGVLAAQGAAKESCTIVSSLPGPGRERDDYEQMLASLGRLWVSGARPTWGAISPAGRARRTSLPTYPFQRSRHWLEAPVEVSPAGPAAVASEPVAAAVPPPRPAVEIAVPQSGAAPERARQKILDLLEELSGESLASADPRSTFLELGFDSLFLGRFALQLNSRFGCAITFRQLLNEIPSMAALSDAIASHFPEPAAPVDAPAVAARSNVESAVMAQLEAMARVVREQIQAMGRLASAPAAVPAASPAPTAALPSAVRLDSFGPSHAVANVEITPAQRAHIDELIAVVTARTPGSKALTQGARAVLADPRVAAGFRSEWKEMVYPIACRRAKGSRIWDVDGNEYIDLLNGFGQTAFGHSPDFVVAAVTEQLERGFAIGPQTELACEAAQLFCEITGNQRVTFCNTGSEAVMAALRVARTVTGRDRFVTFNGDYHGQFDEVLIKGTATGRTMPLAPGIPSAAVSNAVVLAYGEPASLEWLREHASELAAVLVEPVQSRHPALQPRAFLAELRAITESSGAALIFDEVVTGFRMHPGGMQALFDIRADMATYGKVVGGGLPIGILAGSARYLDALDGGMWQYGDDSIPEVAPTFVAGTFVRHPLVMAAVVAVLRHIKAAGADLQERLSRTTAEMVARLNVDLKRRGIRSRIETFGSLFYVNFGAEDRLAGLLYYHLRNRGIYISEGFPCFLTTAHDAADVERIVAAFAESLDALQSVGILAAAESRGPALVAEAALSIPLTEEQTEIWLSAQLGDEASCAFNESVTLRLRGALDQDAFGRAWNAVLARHEALRGSFGATGELMRVAPRAAFSYQHDDISNAPDAEAELALAIAGDAATPFDLAGGPLIRGRLFRLATHEHAFVLTAHHIVCDGWSMNVILEEFGKLYAADVLGAPPDLGSPVSFAEFARAQRERNAEESARVESFWLSRFERAPDPLQLPADRRRPAKKSFRGATRSTTVEADAYAAIKKAGAREGCTLFVTLLAAFGALIGRLADQDDIVIGIPAAAQSNLENGCLVGHCVDFLPLRARWDRGTRLSDLLAATKRTVLDAYEHQSYTLGTLVRALALARESNRVPLAEVQFNLERLAERVQLPGLEVETEPNAKAFVNFDLFFNVVESSNGLRIDCDYSTDLFDAATIDRWLGYYRALLDALVAEPHAAVDCVRYAPAETVAGTFNETSRAYPSDASIVELFAAQVAARPYATAVSCEGASLSYAELDRRTSRLARRLRSVAETGSLIAVCAERSLDVPVALLATLKAGCAYVPLDPSHPPARLQRILEEAGVAALVTDARHRELAGGRIPTVDLEQCAEWPEATDEAALSVPAAESLAYVIYTSGSTGVPKGVEITHRSLVNLLHSMANEPGLAAGDTLLAVTTISFDIAALELFLPLVVGASVEIAPDRDVRDGHALADRLESSGATCMQATPATWRMLVEAGFRAKPRFKMLCGGEALHRDLADALLAGEGELWNMYGPTETTIWSSCKRILADDKPITIGFPIDNTKFYVLDRQDRIVPPGGTGQLHIGGDGVARGYVNQPRLTAEKFVADPFSGGRMYRTGDLAQRSADGEIVVLGRMDLQVKLRGYRIELGEIEALLSRTGRLAGAAVELREDVFGKPALVGYYVDRPGAVSEVADLRDALSAELPEYMVPTVFVRLDALPLTPNGKLDRAALPGPAREPAATEPGFSPPQTPLECALAEIWEEVLQRDHIGRTDDLLELGADSIQLFKITARANRQGILLLAKQLMKHRTIANVASLLEGSEAVS